MWSVGIFLIPAFERQKAPNCFFDVGLETFKRIVGGIHATF